MSADGAIFCGGGTVPKRETHDCPVCGIAGSELVVKHAGSAWWGVSVVCTNCGDEWSDGEVMERPFRRGWRQESIARAVAYWEAACPCPVQYDDTDHFAIPCEHMRVAS